MGFMNIIFKFSAVIAIVGISLSYTDLGKHVVKTIHRLTPDWLNPHAKKSTSPSDDLEVYKVISDDGDRLFSKEELAQYVGDDEIYLAILGRVYDVTAGKDFYTRGEGTYGFFTGKDGTRAYMTGEFNETGLIEDTTGLTLTQMTELEKWIEFYDNKYTYKGKLHGLYYDENGKPTQELFKVRDRMLAAKKVKKAADLERQRFPPCNQEWNQQTTARVWCTDKSGGVTRDWVGVPRKFFPPGAKQEQCVCVRTKGPPSDNPTGTTDVGDLENPHLRLYKGCDAASFSCALLD